jgi:hypothetical protein
MSVNLKSAFFLSQVVSKIDDDVVATVANTMAKGKPRSFGKK